MDVRAVVVVMMMMLMVVVVVVAVGLVYLDQAPRRWCYADPAAASSRVRLCVLVVAEAAQATCEEILCFEAAGILTTVPRAMGCRPAVCCTRPPSSSTEPMSPSATCGSEAAFSELAA